MNVTELKIMADGILGYAQRARRTLDELEKCAADLLRNLSHESCDIYNKDISCICSNGVCSTKEKNKSVLSNAGIKKESPDFDKFWSLYPGPRRVNKKVAAAKFSNFPAETVTAILEAIPNHVRYWKSENLSKGRPEDDCTYVPLVMTWLNQGRWEQELPGFAKTKAVSEAQRQQFLTSLLGQSSETNGQSAA